VRAQIEPIVEMIERHTARSWALSALALTAADDGDIDTAERYARDAVELAGRSMGESALEFHLSDVALGEALRLRGALGEAAERLSHVARVTGKLPSSVYRALTLV
jgi:uncharacterized membrane-anchored protein